MLHVLYHRTCWRRPLACTAYGLSAIWGSKLAVIIIFVLHRHFLLQLDSGSSEKISLMSRDEQNILVVSYAEIKQCVENAFGDILSAANQSGIS